MWKFFTVLIFMLALSNVNYAQQTPLPEGEDDDIVEYTTTNSGQLKVYGMNLNTSSVYGLVKNSSEIASANQQFTLDVSTWQPGVNTLIFEYDGTLIIETFIKN